MSDEVLIPPSKTHNLCITVSYPDRTIEHILECVEGQKITCGSSVKNDILISDPSIAPHHFSFHFNGQVHDIELVDKNTIYKEKEHSFYAGLTKINIEPCQEEQYQPINSHMFKMISDGFSLKKTLGYFLLSLVFLYLGFFNDFIFLKNEASTRSVNDYATFWMIPNIVISCIALSYLLFTYFVASKSQRFFTRIIQQHVIKYGLKLIGIYFFIKVVIYFLNGYFNFPYQYTTGLQVLLIYFYYMIGRKIIQLNQYKSRENKKAKIINILFFLGLLAFSHMESLSNPYVTWIPLKPHENIQNNQSLENETQKLMDKLKDE